MPQPVEMIFDFASPNAYLAWHALRATDLETILTPCLLGGIFKATGNQAPMLAFAGVQGKLAYEALEMRRFVVRHGLHKFAMNPHFPVNTLLLMRGLLATPEADRLAYVQAGLAAMWEDGRNMADPATVQAVLREAGLDAEAILAAAQTDAVKQNLAANTQDAVARGVFGIPTFFVAGEMFFGKERLAQVEACARAGG